MKKSEMVEEIRKILEMNGVDNGFGELEEALLHHIEHFGMLPPQNSKDIHHYNLDALQSLVTVYHTWDKENE